MTLARFLLIDAALILVGVSLFLTLQSERKKTKFSVSLEDSKIRGESFVSTPNLEQLLELEKLARDKGSGIEFDSLIGLWKFESVWKQGTDKEDAISSSLLRLFYASLELKRDYSKQNLTGFEITNSIHFGVLSIRFVGFGNLKGSQPLLPFFFERIELKLGQSVLFRRLLEVPEERNRPFFALISIDDSGQWLAARGRGGGLALWLKN